MRIISLEAQWDLQVLEVQDLLLVLKPQVSQEVLCNLVDQQVQHCPH